MTQPVRFGVTLPQIKRSWEETRSAAIEFDALGFDSVWVCDHLYGVPLPTLPIFEAWSELAAVAAITEHVEQAGKGWFAGLDAPRDIAAIDSDLPLADHALDGPAPRRSELSHPLDGPDLRALSERRNPGLARGTRAHRRLDR